MRKNLFIALTVVFALLTAAAAVCAEGYPEFTGNYIKCGGKWCEMSNLQLNVMMIQETQRTGVRFITYAGFFQVPKEAVRVKNKKPQILLYSGRPQGDPMTTALVELSRLPYNNEPIYEVDGKSYKGEARYRKENAKFKLWTFKREIPLKFRPIEGKVGMYLYEPVEPLPDGFYVIDAGLVKTGGHDGLATKPQYFDYYRVHNAVAAVPFVVGDIKEDVSDRSSAKDAPQDTSEGAPESDTANKNGKKGNALEDAIRGLFGK